MPSNYGLLDPMPLGEEEVEPLKCELCGLLYDDLDNLDSIEDCGLCVECYK